jgi:hypothetical protein
LQQLQGQDLRQGGGVLDGALHVQVDAVHESARPGHKPDPGS